MKSKDFEDHILPGDIVHFRTHFVSSLFRDKYASVIRIGDPVSVNILGASCHNYFYVERLARDLENSIIRNGKEIKVA